MTDAKHQTHTISLRFESTSPLVFNNRTKNIRDVKNIRGFSAVADSNDLRIFTECLSLDMEN
jgi:hypothetical protein